MFHDISSVAIVLTPNAVPARLAATLATLLVAQAVAGAWFVKSSLGDDILEVALWTECCLDKGRVARKSR